MRRLSLTIVSNGISTRSRAYGLCTDALCALTASANEPHAEFPNFAWYASASATETYDSASANPVPFSTVIAMGFVATFGHATMTRAFASADASLVMGVDFARLPFAVIYGFLLFGELIDFWTWVGAGIIFLASLYGANHARKARRRS